MNDQMGKWIHEWMKQTSCNFLRWDTREGVHLGSMATPPMRGKANWVSCPHCMQPGRRLLEKRKNMSWDLNSAHSFLLLLDFWVCSLWRISVLANGCYLVAHGYFTKPVLSNWRLCVFPAKAYWAEEDEAMFPDPLKVFPLIAPCYFYSCFIVHFGYMLLGVQKYKNVYSEFSFSHCHYRVDWKRKLLSCVQLFAAPYGRSSPWNSPGQNTGVGSLSLLQGIFPTQGLNPGLLHCRWILYPLSHQGSPGVLAWVAYPFSSGSSRPRNPTRVSCIAGSFLTSWATRETHRVDWFNMNS